MKKHKVCFVTCINDQEKYQEALLYLQHLVLPVGMEAEYLSVEGADSMAAGYNAAMQQSDAQYKIYLHQDVFLLEKYSVMELINFFQGHPKVGLVGLAGCRDFPRDGVWWHGNLLCGQTAQANVPEYVEVHSFGPVPEPYCPVMAVDGFFMATQYDVPWREDVFDGWHFYDISQSLEFYRHGYEIVVLPQHSEWCIHACGRKNVDEVYFRYREKFFQEYEPDLKMIMKSL